MPDCRFEIVSPRVDRFTPDERTDRPVLGAIRGTAGTLIVDGGASPAHLAAFAAERDARRALCRRLAVDEMIIRTDQDVRRPLAAFFKARERRRRH